MTSTPARIQRRRTAGWRKPEGAVIVTRPSRWGNQNRIVCDGLAVWVADSDGELLVECDSKAEARAVAASEYRRWLESNEVWLAAARRELAGKDLVCWCPLPEPGQPDHCHAAVLISLANQPAASPAV